MFVACPHIGLQWVALLLALIMSFTVLTTYLISIHRGHVNAELPFISSTGAYPPESCIFGEGLNLAAFIIKSQHHYLLIGAVIWVEDSLYPSLICSFFWYLIALERTKFMGIHQPKCVLKFMLLLSLVASVGLTLVGNFQQVNVELIHDIGAGMAFFGTTIYIILCALVSKRYLGTHWCIWAFRLLLGIMAGITSSFFSICHTISRINFNGTQEESLTYRHPGQGGFSFYLCSTSFEWAAGFIIIVFFITWAYEFRSYALQLPQIVKKHPSESDIYSLKS